MCDVYRVCIDAQKHTHTHTRTITWRVFLCDPRFYSIIPFLYDLKILFDLSKTYNTLIIITHLSHLLSSFFRFYYFTLSFLP